MARDSRRSKTWLSGSFSRAAAPRVLLTLLVGSILVAVCAAEPILAQAPLGKSSTKTDVHDFKLRQILYRGVYDFPKLQARIDVPNNPELVITENGPAPAPRLVARSKSVRVQRLSNRSPKYIEGIVTSNRLGGFQALDASAWTEDNTHGPDVTDKETLLTLAMIAENAYYIDEKDAEWEKIGSGYNRSLDFGWEGDSLRGHIYVDDNNSTVVLGVKGTSVAVFDGPETTTNDKINDNLFFGCCCGAQSSLTKKVCNCQQSTNTCGTTCLKKALMDESRYYTIAKELYNNVTEIYPNAEIWIVGHSLGGAVSALLGHTYGRHVVTFQAPAEALAAARIGIPAPPGTDPARPQTWGSKHIHHFGNNADPIFMGACNGVTSSCQYAGYAMETVCHGGLTCIYNVTGEKNWRTSVANHRIRTLIDSVIREYNETANCTVDKECFDCPLWKFVEGNGTSSTTTSTSTTTYTSRTTTCKTPGWWGCLDESTTTTDSGTSTTTDIVTITTTTTTTTTSTSVTTTTSTCKTPGWFGCNDKTTDASKIATTIPTPIISQPSITAPPGDVPSTSSEPETSTHSCSTPGYIYGCRDKLTTTTSTSVSATTTTTTTTRVVNPTTSAAKACETPGWFGLICRDTVESALSKYAQKDDILV